MPARAFVWVKGPRPFHRGVRSEGSSEMTTAPPAVRDRKICMLAYWDSPTALPPMFNHGVSLSADGFDVEIICLAANSAPRSSRAAGARAPITRLQIRSRHFFQRLFGKATAARRSPPCSGPSSYLEFVTKASSPPLGPAPTSTKPTICRRCCPPWSPRGCAASRLSIALTSCGPRPPPTCVSPASGD